MKNICIIPARGGSKRIPRKNIKLFLGKPIISYSIESALDSNLFEDIIVSTDDEEIAEIAIKCGPSVPFFRSAETSNDYASTSSVMKEVLEKLNEKGKKYDNCCCLYPTAPLVTANTLIESFNMLNDSINVVFPIVPFSFPIQRSLKMDTNNILSYTYPNHRLTRSQDLEQRYHDAGQFYFFKIKDFEKRGSIMSENTSGIVLSELQVQDIDNYDDWKIAELKKNLLNNNI